MQICLAFNKVGGVLQVMMVDCYIQDELLALRKTASNIFTCFIQSKFFQVTVIGPNPGTKWTDRVRCHEPSNIMKLNLFDSTEQENISFEWAEAGRTELDQEY